MKTPLRYCFLHTVRIKCEVACMANIGTASGPECAFLKVVEAAAKVFTGQTMTIRHPASAPPPEVHT